MREPSDAVIDLARQGRKIDAIKLLREEQGLGLAEAKAVVDGLEPVAGSSRPKAGSEESTTGRLVLILVVAAAAIGFFYFL